MAGADLGTSTSVSNVLKLSSGLQAPRSALKTSFRRPVPLADRQKLSSGSSSSLTSRTVANSSSSNTAQAPPLPSSATVASMPPLVPTPAFEAVMWKHNITWTRAAVLWGLVKSQTASSLPPPQSAEPRAAAAAPTPPSTGSSGSRNAKSRGANNTGSSTNNDSTSGNYINGNSNNSSVDIIEDEDSGEVLSTFTEACKLCSAAVPLCSSSHLRQLCASIMPWSTLGFLLAKYSDADAWHEWPNARAPNPEDSPTPSGLGAETGAGGADGPALKQRNYFGVKGVTSQLLAQREAQSDTLAAAIDQHDCINHGAALKAPRLAQCFGGLDPVRCGSVAPVLGLYFGDIDALDRWVVKVLAFYQSLDLVAVPETPTAAWSTGGDSSEDEDDAGSDNHASESNSSGSSSYAQSTEGVSSTHVSSDDGKGFIPASVVDVGLSAASTAADDATSSASLNEAPSWLSEDAKKRWPSGAEGREARLVAEAQEILVLVTVVLPLLLVLQRGPSAEALCDALGFEFLEKGVESLGFERWWAALTKGNVSDGGLQNYSSSSSRSTVSCGGSSGDKYGGSLSPGSAGLVGFEASHQFNRTSVSVALRLLIFLTSPDGVVRKKDVRKWIPSPSKLLELDTGGHWDSTKGFGLSSCCALGARAYLRLRQPTLAYEAAELGLAHLKKPFVRVECHRVAASVLAARGEISKAEEQLTKALGCAHKSRLPVLQVLVAKDWGEILPSDYVGLLGADEAALIQAAALGQVPMRCRPSLEASLLMSEEARAEQRLLHKAIEKFRLIDADGGGTLDLHELEQGAHLLGLSVADAQHWFKLLDEDGSGEISLELFLREYQELDDASFTSGNGSAAASGGGDVRSMSKSSSSFNSALRRSSTSALRRSSTTSSTGGDTVDNEKKPARRGIMFSSDVIDHGSIRAAEKERAAMDELQAERDRQAQLNGFARGGAEDEEFDVVAFAESFDAGGDGDGSGVVRSRGRSRSLVQH